MNKTILLLLLTFSLLTINTKAQNPNLEFGLKAGANYSKYTPRNPIPEIKDVYYSGKFGFYLGGFLNFEVSENFNVQPELIFATQGALFNSENIYLYHNEGRTLVDFETNIIESTIIIPIVAQYFVTEKLYMEGGPQFGYIVDRNEKVKKDPFKAISGNNTVPEDFDYDKFDMGLTFGLGCKLSEKIGINSRYFVGLIERNNTVNPRLSIWD